MSPWVPECWLISTSHSTLQNILAPTLLFLTGQVVYNQCVGAFEM